MKAGKPAKNFNTPNTKKGMGDFYGTGIKNPTVKPKEVMGMKPLEKGKIKKPPKSLA